VKPIQWLGATVRNVSGLGEVSAFGLGGESGVLVLEAPVGSLAAALGLREGDVIVQIGKARVDSVRDLRMEDPIRIIRNQRQVTLGK